MGFAIARQGRATSWGRWVSARRVKKARVIARRKTRVNALMCLYPSYDPEPNAYERPLPPPDAQRPHDGVGCAFARFPGPADGPPQGLVHGFPGKPEPIGDRLHQDLARRLGWAETQLRRVLDPRRRSRLEDIEAALGALGKRLVIEVENAA